MKKRLPFILGKEIKSFAFFSFYTKAAPLALPLALRKG